MDSLVDQARRGSKAAFSQLAAERIDALYATAARILRDGPMAQDATQEALLDAWRNLDRLRDPERFDAWLYRVLVNQCTSELHRRRARERVVHLLQTPPVTTDSASEIAQRDELERAFRDLSPEHRSALVLRYYLGWTPSEIAATLGLRAGTVSSRLHYALKAMRAALAADERRTERCHG